MAEKASVPDSWIGQEVNVRYVDADAPRWLDCTLGEVGEHGVCVSAGEKTSFFPWGSLIKIDLGHAAPSRMRGR